ncbi:hypothetical protein B0H14DRAFT_2797489 [Mycena olivaceomarginata]|nr:hypothetical protein B0H14DRAFT_2797489 [Mycena olivaceomarginata]
MSLSLSEAQLLGNWFETLTYGMYFVTCGFCARNLLCIGPEDRGRRPSEIRWFILSVGITLFVVATFDVVAEEEQQKELSDISGWINVARTVAQVIQMILGDFVLVSRCYIVYSRRWKVLIPSLILYIGGIAMAIKLVEAQASLKHQETTMDSSDIRPWTETLFCITAVSLLIWRIWRVEREIEKLRVSTSGTTNNQPFRKVIRVIAESGFAYTLMVFLTFVVNVCNSNLIYPFANSTLQATGIAFNVIIIRTSPSRDEQFTVFADNGPSATEDGAPTRLRFHSHITELPADIDDDKHQHI